MARPFRGTTPADRFWANVDRSGTGCWWWTGHLGQNNRYGMIRVNGRSVKAHRFSWELHFGPIPPGQVVRHRCDNTRCVRPDHLQIGTQRDNVADTVQRGRLGARPGSPKLTPEQVTEIRRRHSPRRVTYAMLAEEFGVSYSAIQNICRGKSWKAGERAGASRERSDPALPDSVQPQFTGAL